MKKRGDVILDNSSFFARARGRLCFAGVLFIVVIGVNYDYLHSKYNTKTHQAKEKERAYNNSGGGGGYSRGGFGGGSSK